MYDYKNSHNYFEEILVKLLWTIGEFVASIALVYFVSFTFGAYLFENFERTLFFSILISLLCIMPSFIYCKHNDPVALIDTLFFKQDFKDKVEYFLVNLAYSAIIGSWFGALVIPLDWDRWWQEWPISCCFGALIGFVLGFFVTIVKNFSRKKHHL